MVPGSIAGAIERFRDDQVVEIVAVWFESRPVPAGLGMLVGNFGGSCGEYKLGQTTRGRVPATKDVEVYNAIFKSLREHLF
jgi:hypothetical protein